MTDPRKTLSDILSTNVRSYLDMSTEHITARDLDILQKEWPVVRYAKGAFVWIILASDANFQARLQSLSDIGLTPQCIQILRAASELKCRFIRFDDRAPARSDVLKLTTRYTLETVHTDVPSNNT